MSQRLAGTGLLLPPPQSVYPTELYNAPQDFSSNEITLAPGDAIAVPAGDWFIHPGKYGVIQFLDPVTGIWRAHPSGYSPRNQTQQVTSDGTNLRIANLLGCPIAAVVTNAGTGYVQSSTTCVASTGGSTWYPIVGGMVSVTTVQNAGSGYGVAPIVFFPAPPNPGVQATGYSTLTSGTVSAITMTNWGAGYTIAPTAVILPSPYDPNLASTTAIVAASCTAVLFGSGSISAILCTNNGLPASPTLTIAGAGASATASTVQLTTLTGTTVFNAGTGITDTYGLFTVGGVPTGNVNTNPDIELTGFLPRPAQATFTNSGGSITTTSTIIDGGMFAATPTVFGLPSAGSIGATGASIGGIFGSDRTTIIIQPAP